MEWQETMSTMTEEEISREHLRTISWQLCNFLSQCKRKNLFCNDDSLILGSSSEKGNKNTTYGKLLSPLSLEFFVHIEHWFLFAETITPGGNLETCAIKRKALATPWAPQLSFLFFFLNAKKEGFFFFFHIFSVILLLSDDDQKHVFLRNFLLIWANLTNQSLNCKIKLLF